MTVSLVHPSRGRAQKAFDTAWLWLDKAGVEVEYIISLDFDDPQKDLYAQKFLTKGKVIADNKSVVQATNNAAKLAKGDILVYLSDDFRCPYDWGTRIIKEFEKYKGPTLIKVDDLLQPFNNTVLTIPIMNREFYNLNGYFFHPDFKSMFADVHLYFRAKKLGALKLAPHLKFPHDHYSIGKCEVDETYKRSEANWNQGEAMMAKHKALSFSE